MATQTLAPRKPAPPRPGQSRPHGRIRPRTALVLVAALVVAILGGGELAAMLRTRTAPLATDTITLGGLTIRIDRVSWVAFDANDPALLDPTAAGGYKMPSKFMPGAPADGEGRLNLEIALADRGGSARALDTASEFYLGGGGLGSGEKLSGDTFGDLPRINPGYAVDGKLYFDLKPPKKKDPPLYLEWRRGGDKARLLLVPGGTASTHHH